MVERVAALFRGRFGVVVVVLLVVVAFICGRYTAPRQTALNAPCRVETETTGELTYTPKKTPSDADLDVRTPRQTFRVSVNGKKHEFTPATDEKFMFEKNKITYTQRAAADIRVEVPDTTRRWSVGVGISKDGPAYMLKFPIKKHVGGWACGTRERVAAGICVNF